MLACSRKPAEGLRGVHDLSAHHRHHGFDASNHLLRHGEVVVAEDSEIGILARSERADLMIVEGKPRRALGIQAQRLDARHLLAVVGQHASDVTARCHVEE